MFVFDYLSSREFSYFRGIKQKLKDLRPHLLRLRLGIGRGQMARAGGYARYMSLKHGHKARKVPSSAACGAEDGTDGAI